MQAASRASLRNMQDHQEPPTEANETTEQRFGRRMRRARERAGLTQAGIAEALAAGGLKVDPTAITRMEKGERGIRLNEARAIADVLGSSVLWMLSSEGGGDIEDELEALEAEEKRLVVDLGNANMQMAVVAQERQNIAERLQVLRERADALRTTLAEQAGWQDQKAISGDWRSDE